MSKISQRSVTLLQRVDTATGNLLTKYSELIDLASTSGGKDQGTVASETLQIETNATTIVRSIEDLLFVTRSLKEAWILGRVRPAPAIGAAFDELDDVIECEETKDLEPMLDQEDNLTDSLKPVSLSKREKADLLLDEILSGS
ncbi:hypothetical protein NADFUDRAFT_53050 [Nadsonia fulvescens var. elongata DSM 6958]|uniref:Mediator of RNA polymerase II transcription subunit 22 n=1 Tax=Nadsonia fulvescens var. elongata DSM 6958 TaxID=857566 RepID=A0A1E3PFI6_9ASCO|nr:hypothetical protein NADFUDRAFT_53050 [Nadsonia fulvescens var. elongata DSM 6958]